MPEAQTHTYFGYRNDIDGLRAIAVGVIVLYHCGFSGLRGGFVGVDIFFVISGYLITAIISREIARGDFSIGAFYRRRALRILPALGIMVAATVLWGCNALFPISLRDLGMSVVATAVFSSNIYFWQTSDYFAQASDLKPLVHTWSLGVEEQFYLLYPVLLMTLARQRLLVKQGAIAALVTASLMISTWQAMHAASAGFFLLPSRIWELGLGALVALGAYPRIHDDRVRAIISYSGLGLIVASCFIIKAGWLFPAPWAIPPVIGAVLLIAYGERSPTARVLTWAPIRRLGLISYSLYLWHRPIISYWEIAHGTQIPLIASTVLLAVSLGLATASYILVERPFLRLRHRHPQGNRSYVLPVAAAGLGVALLIGLGVNANAALIRPLSPAVAHVAGFEEFETTRAGRAQFSTGRCFTIPTDADFDRTDCLTPVSGRVNLLLLGDSHGAQLSQALRAAFPEAHLLQATAAGCRPVIGGRGLPRCLAVGHLVFDGGLNLKAVDKVILAARWLPEEVPALLQTIAFFRRQGLPVTVVGPMVEYSQNEPTALASAMLTGHPHSIDALRQPEREALDRQLAPQVRAAGARYVSAFAEECPQGYCRLTTTKGDPVHFDQSHLTPSGADDLIRGHTADFAAVRRSPRVRGSSATVRTSVVAARDARGF